MINKWVKFFCVVLLLGFSMIALGQPKPLTVVLDWFVNPDHAPLFVAQQQGFFKAEGLQVKIIAPADPTDAEKLVAVGRADLGIGYQPQLIMAMDQGLPLIRVGTLIATPLNALAVLKSSKIKKIQDLKGKRIAYSGSHGASFMLSTMLKQAGLSTQDVTLINVKYNVLQALLSGQADAVTGIMRNIEPVAMAKAGKPVRLFLPEEYGIPDYDELVIIASPAMRKDLRLTKFLRALQQGVLYLVNHPEQSWQQFAAKHPALNNELNHQAWLQTIPRFALRPAAKDKHRYQRLAHFMQRAWIIKHSPSFEVYWGNTHG